MLKIIARYTMEGDSGYYNFFQEVESYDISSLNIPENCFLIILKSVGVVENRQNLHETFLVTPKPIEKVIYIGKEISLEELKERYGDDPKYEIFIGNVERNDWRVVLDRTGKPRTIDFYGYETITEVVQM